MLCLQLQANAQYKGGVGQGITFAMQANANLGPNIYRGGSGDGISVAALPNANLGPNIYQGGPDDGVTVSLAPNANLGLNIYRGGSDDGVSAFQLPNANLGQNIYRGGGDDGFTVSLLSNASLGENIYKGGGNDGWAVSTVGFFIPLPITLTRFTGEWALDDARLQWETASEQNSDHFELQRSFDGRDFESIGQLAAAGESSQPRQYDFTDVRVRLTLPSGTVYYRLKSVDRDGSFIYSAVVILKSVNTQVTYSLYPNPARDKITLQITGNGPSAKALLNLYDLRGRLLSQTTMMGNRQQLSVSNLSAGTYIVELLLDGKPAFTQKIIVQK